MQRAIGSSTPDSTTTIGAWAASQNDYALTNGKNIYRVSATAEVNLTGIAAPANIEQPLTFINVGATYAITLKYDSASSSAANRIYTPDGADYELLAGRAVMVRYNNANTRWRIVSGSDSSQEWVGDLFLSTRFT